jgi:ornithine cyclodeaminase/alanine dehydrogenase-like protein (mu-crystallin family)
VSAPETLVLARHDVRALLGLDECIAAVEAAFRLHSEGRSLAPAVLGVPAEEGGFHIKAAGLDLGRRYFAAKTNGNFPGNPRKHGLPAIQGVIVLCDAGDGRVLAVMDSMEVTTLRTAAATAVAARLLARADSATATICGCGTQGREHLRALARVLPLRRAYAFDTDETALHAFVEEFRSQSTIEIVPARDLAGAVGKSDVCVTCTPSRAPLLFRGDVGPGTFVAAVGADNADKQELDPLLMAAGTVVVDVLDQCATIGDLHHGLEAGALTREDVHGDLGSVITGRKPGRQSPTEITIFDSTGTALEDVAAAAVVYEKAVAAGAGLPVSLGR